MAENRSRDVSEALTEIRTVRSRAQSAIARLNQNGGELERERIPAHFTDEDEYVPPLERRFKDPDADEMIALLTEFISKTTRFAKRGRV